MLALLTLACGTGGPDVTLPEGAGGAPTPDLPVVLVTPESVWLEAGGETRKVDDWATATTQGMLLPGLSAALSATDRVAVSADGATSFEQVARVLYTLGQGLASGVEFRSTTAGIPYSFPTYCGAMVAPPKAETSPEPGGAGSPGPTEGALAEKNQRILELLAAGPTGPCLSPSVTRVAGGLRVDLVPIEQDKPGCTVAIAGNPEPGDWRNAVALSAAGACPSAVDAGALDALLKRTAPLQQPCGTAFVSMPPTTPWRDVLPAYAVVSARHSATSLGLSGDATPGCERGFVLP